MRLRTPQDAVLLRSPIRAEVPLTPVICRRQAGQSARKRPVRASGEQMRLRAALHPRAY